MNVELLMSDLGDALLIMAHAAGLMITGFGIFVEHKPSDDDDFPPWMMRLFLFGVFLTLLAYTPWGQSLINRYSN
jgi:hypothetical protein